MNGDHFFREANEQEKRMIAENEEMLYRRERRNYVILMLLFASTFSVALISFFAHIGIGMVLRIVMITVSLVLAVIVMISLRTIARQRNEIRASDYKVQDVIIIDVHNEIHGLKSDQHVTFEAMNGETYKMNTHTTGDMGLVRGAKGLLVILNGERNILLTCKYRFFPIVTDGRV